MRTDSGEGAEDDDEEGERRWRWRRANIDELNSSTGVLATRRSGAARAAADRSTNPPEI